MYLFFSGFLLNIHVLLQDLVVAGGQLVSLITIHGAALLFNVNGHLDFTSEPLLLSD